MSTLTRAEQDALDAVARHGSIKAAAYALGKSPHTLTVQLANARRTLGADSTVQAYARARSA